MIIAITVKSVDMTVSGEKQRGKEEKRERDSNQDRFLRINREDTENIGLTKEMKLTGSLALFSAT